MVYCICGMPPRQPGSRSGPGPSPELRYCYSRGPSYGEILRMFYMLLSLCGFMFCKRTAESSIPGYELYAMPSFDIMEPSRLPGGGCTGLSMLGRCTAFGCRPASIGGRPAGLMPFL